MAVENGSIRAVDNLASWLTSYLTVIKFVVTVFIAQYLTTKLYSLWIYPVYLSPLRHLPGPKDNTFLLGQFLQQIKAKSVPDLFVSWARRWPDAPFIRFLTLGNTEILLSNSIQVNREVLQSKCYSFVKPDMFTKMVKPITGTGLLFAEGDEHRKQRRLLSSPFSQANIRKLLPVFKKKGEDMVKLFETALKENNGSIEVMSVIVKATLDVIGVTTLGIELDSLSQSSSFEQCYDRLLNQSALSSLISVLATQIPIRSFLPIEANTGLIRANQELRRMLLDLIQDRRVDLKDGILEKEHARNDLLTFMVQEGHTGDDAWTDEDVLGFLMNFMSAGHETIASSLIWSLYILPNRKEVQAKLQSEILAMLDETPNPNYEDIEKLSYLNNFFRETLRVYSPAVWLARSAAQDLIIEGTHIPKGTLVVVNPAMANLDQNVWGPDADEFKPERWDKLSEAATSPYAFETFSNGPRICLGKAFAVLEYKVLMIEIIRHFIFVSGPEHVEVISSVTYRPKDGLVLEVERRE